MTLIEGKWLLFAQIGVNPINDIAQGADFGLAHIEDGFRVNIKVVFTAP
ncbi:MAG: hypothetical protein M0036_18620 [Desulfobacteraceae bacterium]|nr:hypothetical protein [Desulfobacteraceae bacterium]